MQPSREQEDDGRGFAFIGAVHELLTSARSAQKTDLLLAAVLQALYEADREFGEIVRRVDEIWPGAVQSSDDIQAALDVGSELRLVARTEALEDRIVWTLTKTGAEDVRQHASWVSDIRQRAREQVRERALTGLLAEISDVQADLFLDRLVHGLAEVIRASQAPYIGQVDALLNTGRATQRVSPRSLDRQALLNAMDDANEVTTEFLQSLALAAIDPLDPFGNELVSHITTGCILYAFVAGVDRHRLLNRLGDPSGQRAVLDTPLLIELIGPKRLSVGAEQVIRSALEAGWEVIALEHSIEEAQEVLHRDVPSIRATLKVALEERIQENWYASLAEDQLPSLCVEVLRDGTYGNLDQLLLAADRLEQRLNEIGVSVRPHGNDPGEGRVPRLYEALKTQLGGNGMRSEVVLQRDANTMEVVARRRRRQHGSQWPGGWVITKDRYMAPAYAASQTRDKVALTLTTSQWATLLSISAQPADVERLARAAADQFIDEAAWTLPVRYPPDVAMELARQLSPEQGGSETDMRVAQLTLDEALESPSSATIASLASIHR